MTVSVTICYTITHMRLNPSWMLLSNYNVERRLRKISVVSAVDAIVREFTSHILSIANYLHALTNMMLLMKKAI